MIPFENFVEILKDTAFYCFAAFAPFLLGSAFIYVRFKRGTAGLFALSFLSFSFAGASAGFITGVSREPAVTALVPALLTLIGGIAVFTAKHSAVVRSLALIGVAAFSLSILYGTIVGAGFRNYRDAHQHSFAYQKALIYNQFRIMRYKRSLGMPDGTQPGARVSEAAPPLP